MAKQKDDSLEMALIEIQHQRQKPMSANELGTDLALVFPDRATDPAFHFNAAKRADELYRAGIFVVAPRKVRDSRNKLVTQYGLPQYVPSGVTFADKGAADRAAKFEALSALLASTQLTCLETAIRKAGIKVGEEVLVTADMLKIDFTLLKSINLETIERLSANYRSLIEKVAAETITEEQEETERK